MHGINPEQPINRAAHSAAEARLRTDNQANILTNVTDAARSIQNAGNHIAGKARAFVFGKNGEAKAVDPATAREVAEDLAARMDAQRDIADAGLLPSPKKPLSRVSSDQMAAYLDALGVGPGRIYSLNHEPAQVEARIADVLHQADRQQGRPELS